MLLNKVVVTSDADPTVVNRVRKNLVGQSVDWIEVENPQDAFPNVETLHREAKETLVLRARRSSFTKQFNAVPKGSVCTKFHQLTPEIGCNFACNYCYLEKTLRFPHLMLPTHFTNYDRMFKDVYRTLGKAKGLPIIFNVGELADSRAIDHITDFSKTLVPFILSTPNGYLHMLSKSGNYENFLDLDHTDKYGRCRVIQVASVNAQPVADLVEHKAASLEQRIQAMAKFQDAGYRIRYRFDPLMFVGDLIPDKRYHLDDKKDIQETLLMYTEMIDYVFEHTTPEMVTLGTYRPSTGLDRYLSKRFPSSPILNINTRPDKGKGRISEQKRTHLYAWFKKEIAKRSPNTKVALCKETPSAWHSFGMRPSPLECSCLLFANERKQQSELTQIEIF